MTRLSHLLVAFLVITVSACTTGHDSCDGLEGTITHTVTEITGIDSVSTLRRVNNSNMIEAIDQFSGTEFSNLIIQVEFDWIEEQHRFEAPSTFIQSMLSWFVTSAAACSFAAPYDDYQPAVSRIELYSDSDMNEIYVAGSNLSEVFTVTEAVNNGSTLLDAYENSELLSARTYSLEAAWPRGVLATVPDVPKAHIFTIFVFLDDGRVFEIRTPEVLLTGI